MNLRPLILGLALGALVAAVPVRAADKPLTLKVQAISLNAESGQGGKLEASVTQDGKKFRLTADEIHVKLADGAILVEAVGGVLSEVKVAVVGMPVKVDGGWRFTLSDEAATAALGHAPASVNLAGEFNSWNPSDAGYALKKEGAVWSIVVPLQPGKYQYKFVLEGGAKWKEDPSNKDTADDGHGGLNSIVTVQ